MSEHTRCVYQRWYRNREATLAVALETDEVGPVLVTHGGLTVGLWEELGSPDGAADTARALNELLDDPSRAFRPGWLMTGIYDRAAGVTCPRTGAEVAGPWLEAGSMPFHQIHGHEGTWWWPHSRFWDDCPAPVAAATTVDETRRFCRVQIGERWLWSIDWVLGAEPPAGIDWEPLTLHGELSS